MTRRAEANCDKKQKDCNNAHHESSSLSSSWQALLCSLSASGIAYASSASTIPHTKSGSSLAEISSLSSKYFGFISLNLAFMYHVYSAAACTLTSAKLARASAHTSRFRTSSTSDCLAKCPDTKTAADTIIPRLVRLAATVTVALCTPSNVDGGNHFSFPCRGPSDSCVIIQRQSSCRERHSRNSAAPTLV